MEMEQIDSHITTWEHIKLRNINSFEGSKDKKVTFVNIFIGI